MCDESCARLAAAASALTVADPLVDPLPDIGPMIDSDRVGAVEAIVDETIELRASWIGAAPLLPATGTYTRPGFPRDISPQSAMATSEVFGPITGVFGFEDDGDVIAQTNDAELGLAGYVYTKNISRAWRLAERLQVGIIGLNHPVPSVVFAPMGGVKQSGFGREGARHGLEECLENCYLSLGIDD